VTDTADRPSPAAASPDFPIEWLTPHDAELSWEWDDMHMPMSVAPLAADYVRTLASGFAYGYQRLGIPVEILVRVLNGYAYFTVDTDVPEADRDAMWARRDEAARAQIPLTAAYWSERAIPELRTHYGWVAAVPVETMPIDELAAAWDEAWTRIGRCWSIHFYAIRGPYQVLEDLADLYEEVVADASPGEALGLIGGGVHELHDVERRLEVLAGLVAATPGLADRFRRGDVTAAELATRPDATALVAGLAAFLAEHGHLGQGFDDLASPSWAEDPDLLLTELAKRVEYRPTVTAEERRERQAAQAETLAAGVRTRLADDPARLERFEALLGFARQIGPLTEVHNYWIDRMAQASIRRFVMRVAGRLVADDVIGQPNDVFFLRRDEIPELLRRPADRRQVVVARRAEQAHWAAILPPRKIGAPSEDGERDRFDGERFESTEPDALRGTGASAGLVRGRARVTRSQDDFGAVQPGDIIVCASSNPSWVPLFAIAGGLITDTGGVLSHAAVVAREFALPAVVGTGDATHRIADGRLVELDGSTGIVRLL
jgi:rifampicin phosphotransferase